MFEVSEPESQTDLLGHGDLCVELAVTLEQQAPASKTLIPFFVTTLGRDAADTGPWP